MRRAWEVAIGSGAVLLALFLGHGLHGDYAEPLHVDEWWHLSHVNAILDARDTTYVEPYYGLRTNTDTLELGYHLMLAQLVAGTGMDMGFLAEWGASILLAAAAVVAWGVGRALGAGPWAAVLVALTPTNVGILGPGFLVPVALGFLVLPPLLLLGEHARRPLVLAAIFALLAFLFYAHAPTGAAGALVAVVAAAAHGETLRERVKRTWPVVAVATVALLVFLARHPEYVLRDVGAVASGEGSLFGQERPGVLTALEDLGLWFAALFLLGVFAALAWGSPLQGAAAASATLFFAIVYLGRLADVGSGFLYLRGYQYFFALGALVGGIGVAAVAERLSLRATAQWRAAAALALGLVLVAPAVAHAAQRDVPLYHVVGEGDLAAFALIEEQVPEEYGPALMDPWKARAFTPLTGRPVYAILPPRDDPELGSRVDAARRILASGVLEKEELRAADVHVIYGARLAEDPEVLDLGRNVYVWCDPQKSFERGPCATQG